MGVDDEPPPELNAAANRLANERAHPGYAREKARQVLEEFGAHRPPVVVHAIARAHGFEIAKSSTLGALSGRLKPGVIEVNAGQPSVRQRFTVAHELGHYFLGTRHGDEGPIEAEADAFAGELLVPGEMLRRELNRTQQAAELAALFKVSRQTLEIAAQHHGLFERLE